MIIILEHLYKYQKLRPYQIDKAIDKGEYLDYLYKYQKDNITNKQKQKIKKLL